ncbi:MAG TPA: serine/threonine-protein kinase [Thermoanaerobaculia bacterium]
MTTCSHRKDDQAGICPACLLELALQADAARFTPGTVLNDRFRITALIGRGGMGEIYRADDLKLGQAVALKFVPPSVRENDELLRRLYNEIRLGRQVAHPNVCRMFDLDEYGGRPFIVMEFVDGEDLESLTQRIGALPREKALDLAREICAALAASHDRKVIHGDLKPANIMIDGTGHARISDFGLSAIAGESRSIVAGTFPYMAPEVFEGQLSARSDLYALGVVLRELLTDAPAELEEMIARCLAVDPENRPTSARQILGAFPSSDPLEAALAAGETPSPEMVAAAEPASQLSSRNAWLLSGVVLLALLVFLFTREHFRTSTPSTAPSFALQLYLVLLLPLLVAGVVMTRRNLRAGRGDIRGARRVAGFVFFCRLLYSLLSSHHVASIVDESEVLATGLAWSLFYAAEVWLGYLAVEPYIRRWRPRTIIGWKRLLDGRLTDPIVGSDLLIGAGFGVGMVLLEELRGLPPATFSVRSWMAMLFYVLTRAIFYALFALFLLVLLRVGLQGPVIASTIWTAIVAVLFAQTPNAFILGIALALLLLLAISRFGLLAAAASLFTYLLLIPTP